MTTLTNIEQDFSQVWAEVDANGVLSDEAASRLDALTLDAAAKIDGYVWQIKAQKGDAKKFKELADEIYAKARTAQNRADWLEQRVKGHMEFMGTTELKGEHWRFALQKSGKPPVEVLVPVEALPRSLVKITVTPDKELIRAAILAKFVEPDVARLGEPTVSVRIF